MDDSSYVCNRWDFSSLLPTAYVIEVCIRSVCVCIYLSVWAITFEAVDTETIFGVVVHPDHI